MGPKQALLGKIIAMIKATMLYKLFFFVIPGNILPTHIKVTIPHEAKLSFNLVRKKLIVIIKKCKIIALCLATRKITRRAATRMAGSMDTF